MMNCLEIVEIFIMISKKYEDHIQATDIFIDNLQTKIPDGSSLSSLRADIYDLNCTLSCDHMVPLDLFDLIWGTMPRTAPC